METDGSTDRRQRRVIVAYQAMTLAVAFFATLWSVIFALHGHKLMALAELFPAVVAILCFALVTAGKLDLFLLIAQISFLVFILGFCLLFDVPDPHYPRVSHLFLPVLAMMGYINHLRRPTFAQASVIAASLATFVFLHASNSVSPFADPIPQQLRAVGVWVNPALAAILFTAAIYALQRRLSAPRGLARELLGAMRRGELSLAYQPQVDRDGRVTGAEALLRWQHPTRGAVSPAEFVPLAEEMGIMPVLGAWVLDEAGRTLARWQADPALARLTLSVNVSASQFNESDFTATIRQLLASHAIAPARLRLELTESVLLSGLEPVAEKMEILKRDGVAVSLDDFGTGYSSLAYLRRLPVNELKIDRSFVAGLADSDRATALVRSIVSIARDLDLQVVAEGVETPAQHAILREIGCHLFQGWLFGRPVARDDFELMLREKHPAAAAMPQRLQVRRAGAL
ncbi:EAL domain-containing protein [Rhizobium sp. AG855]|uniref:putative bifunctional diguanylate cyclase/phosphodiesterase n=1 Tax=Rhizobium sp. AG855 TaxID=2183898 RepID=UPI000FF3CB34|nr:EAL domain-containing protein [Rhizobium sp. AG855]RKE84103.1 EAL domain-containing protein (putative c-di-GMP-specific phosphodiesterase class I) [Rhizobium sp. AG855]